MNREMSKCTMCEGALENRTVFEDPQKGTLTDVLHQVCLNCGESFYGPGIVDKINHFLKGKPGPVAHHG